MTATTTGLKLIEATFTSWDGEQLFYRAWLPEAPTKRAILLFHRGHEHSGRWTETVEKLHLENCAIFAWDQRGHGRSPGTRGDAPSVSAVVKDAHAFARHVCAAHGARLEETAVVATSLGAVIAAAWVHDFAPPIRGMVLAAPAFDVNLYMPLAIPCLRLKQGVKPGGFVKSYVRSTMLTHDRAEAAAYDRDGMIFREIAIGMLLDLHDTGRRLVRDAGAIRVPTLVLAAGKDWVVKRGAQREFVRRLSSPVKKLEVLPGFYHALFQEAGRDKVITRVREFVQECFARPQDGEGLLDADKRGFTFDEHERLRKGGSGRFALTRGLLKTAGRLSKGVRLGWQTGFDSGKSLDYVYRNQASGITPVGKFMDRMYLNAIGWRGVRVRREHLQTLLRRAINDIRTAGMPARILDVASGPGRYVLETMQELRGTEISATLRDNLALNVEAAARMASEMGLTNVITERGDAFDRASVAAIRPRPTVAIASGIYELFPQNARVLESLRGIHQALEPNGLLLYTCQPWHPQIEFIARALTNREGQRWVMRRRTQAEMDALVREAGFEKIEQEIDRWGMFTVSLARRAQQS